MTADVRALAYEVLVAATVAAAAAGCGGLEPIATYEPVTDPEQLYLRLTLDDHRVNLSTAPSYNTIQLTATPWNAAGTPMAGLPAPTFRLQTPADSIRMRVTPGGLVTGLRQTVASGIAVIAELLTADNVLHADTVRIQVTALALPPVLTSFSIDPVPPDSAVWYMQADFLGGALLGAVGAPVQRRVRPVALSATGSPITGLLIEYMSLDTAIATVDISNPLFLGVVTRRPGRVRVVARTTAYGVTMTDTTTFSVRLPLGRDVIVQTDAASGATVFNPSEVRIVEGGSVYWQNTLGVPVDATFEDPTNVVEGPTAVCEAMATRFVGFLGPGPHCGAGNVLVPGIVPPNSVLTTLQVRQFPVPGVYPYRSTSTGATGRVVVFGNSVP